jgi:hypothetical protein
LYHVNIYLFIYLFILASTQAEQVKAIESSEAQKASTASKARFYQKEEMDDQEEIRLRKVMLNTIEKIQKMRQELEILRSNFIFIS